MEEEIEESIVKKVEPAKLKGKNFFLYVFLIFNTLMGLFVLQVQMRDDSRPPTVQKKVFTGKPSGDLGVGAFVKFDLIVTNLAEYNGPRRYIRIAPVIEVTKGQNFEEISLKKNVIRNEIISYLNTLTPGQVLGETGPNNLKSEVKKIFKKTLTHTQINMLYFSEFRVN